MPLPRSKAGRSGRRHRWSLAPDGQPRPDAPFGRGPLAARLLSRVIDLSSRLGSVVPAGPAHRIAVVGGHLEWALRPAKRRQLATNIAHAVDRPSTSKHVRSLVRREFVNEARRSADLLWAIGRRHEFLAGTQVIGSEHAAAAAARGKGLIVAGAHIGGWEVATAVPGEVVPVPTTVVVADDWLAWAIQHVRAAAGLRVVYASQLSLEPLRVLRRGEALLMLGDDGTRSTARSFPVQLCGATAVLPGGVVALARLAGAPIVPFTVLPRGPRQWVVTIEPAIEPPDRESGHEGERAVLQLLADRWTETVRRHPEHWAASFPIEWRDP